MTKYIDRTDGEAYEKFVDNIVKSSLYWLSLNTGISKEQVKSFGLLLKNNLMGVQE